MNFKVWLEATKEEFWDLARKQRDRPEHAMLKFQFLMGGGVMNSAAEHVGDLTHRMAEQPTFSYVGYEYVKEKVIKTLRWLTNPYGFEKEFEENVTNSAKYLNVDEDEFRQKIYASLQNYAAEHLKLVTYNEAQRLAKMAAVHLGERRFSMAIANLRKLESHLKSREDWVKFAHENLDS